MRTDYATRVRELEDEGLCTSDAQAAADVEVSKGLCNPDVVGIAFPLLVRIGAHVYEDFRTGAIDFRTCEDSLATLSNVTDGALWLGIPETWYQD